MATLAAAGINSFKFFMAYKGVFQVSDELLLTGLRKCKELGAIAQVTRESGLYIHKLHRFCGKPNHGRYVQVVARMLCNSTLQPSLLIQYGGRCMLSTAMPSMKRSSPLSTLA